MWLNFQLSCHYEIFAFTYSCMHLLIMVESCSDKEGLGQFQEMDSPPTDRASRVLRDNQPVFFSCIVKKSVSRGWKI